MFPYKYVILNVLKTHIQTQNFDNLTVIDGQYPIGYIFAADNMFIMYYYVYYCSRNYLRKSNPLSLKQPTRNPLFDVK